MSRIMTMAEAIKEATEQLMEKDPNVIVMGEGVPDPKAVFGTTKGLREKFGKDRVYDQPLSENGCTGVLIGAAIAGLKPIMVHQRIDFMLYSMDQLVNNAAKWHSMFGGQAGNVPMVIRCVVGRGWGQGNQHSQNLAPLFASIPGLKVVMPSNAYDAKGLLIAAVKDPNPVIFIEHRWLHETTSHVPKQMYEVPIGPPKKVRQGLDISLVTYGYQVHEARRAASILKDQYNISCEILDYHTLHEFQEIKSNLKTIFIEEAWESTSVFRFDGDEYATISQPSCYVTSSPGPAAHYYITCEHIIDAVLQMKNVKNDRGITPSLKKYHIENKIEFYDQPNPAFRGPF